MPHGPCSRVERPSLSQDTNYTITNALSVTVGAHTRSGKYDLTEPSPLSSVASRLLRAARVCCVASGEVRSTPRARVQANCSDARC